VSLSAGNVVDAAIGAGFADVVTNERNLDTTILVEDKQIVLLGGLIQDDFRDVGRKVPLLGDIPGIGRAFRSDQRTLVKRHLLMFLKAEIHRSGSDAELSARRRYQGIYELRHREDITVPPARIEDLFESRDQDGG
jgi:general secretion pathway protein D